MRPTTEEIIQIEGDMNTLLQVCKNQEPAEEFFRKKGTRKSSPLEQKE